VATYFDNAYVTVCCDFAVSFWLSMLARAGRQEFVLVCVGGMTDYLSAYALSVRVGSQHWS
jgi:O-methyltransferase involved in polyketide biosynthesis